MFALAFAFVYFFGHIFGAADPVTATPTIYEDLPCKFSLAAWNVTLDNANSTGAPLVLGQDGDHNPRIISSYSSSSSSFKRWTQLRSHFCEQPMYGVPNH